MHTLEKLVVFPPRSLVFLGIDLFLASTVLSSRIIYW